MQARMRFRPLSWLVLSLGLLTLGAPGRALAADATPRVVSGQDVSVSTYPFQVSLRQNGSFICGGSIRDATHVITAAHCVTTVGNVPLPAAPFSVGYGSDSLSSQPTKPVSAVSVPSEYQALTLDNSYDVAVLTLSSAIDLSGANAKAIPLVNPAQPKNAGSGLVSGWGNTTESGAISETLKATRVPLRPDADCAATYGPDYVADRGVCAGGGSAPSNNPDTCQGDSGGPLVVDLDSSAGTSFALLGITSFGDGCGRQGVPAVYTYTQGTGVDTFLDAATYQTSTVRSGGDFETGTPGAIGRATSTAAPFVPPQAPPATADTTRPTVGLSALSCKRTKCSFRIRSSDVGGRVSKLSVKVSRRVRVCVERNRVRTCRTVTRTRRLSPKRISGGFRATATLAPAGYKLSAVATDTAGLRSKTLTKRFRVKR